MAENLPDDYEERSRPSAGQMEADADRAFDQMANMTDRSETLSDYLQHGNSAGSSCPMSCGGCAERIIYSLDSNGYLKSPLEELLPPAPAELNGSAEAYRKEQVELAEQALTIVQHLDPPGVGARSLQGVPAAAAPAGPPAR